MKITTLTTLTALAVICNISASNAFTGGYDYQDLLENGGTLYKDSDNSIVQKARVYGRAHYQAASVDGENDHSNYVELRRLRIGAEIDFLNHLELKGNVNLDNGSINDIKVGDYESLDDVKLTLDLAGALGLDAFDSLKVSAGKMKIKIGQDVHTSSTKIKTIERSAVTSRLRPKNSTGVLVKAKNDGVSYSVGLFSNARDDEFNWWEDGADTFLYGSTSFKALGGKVILDGIYNFGDPEDPGFSNPSSEIKWGASAAYLTSYGETDVVYNLFVGDNGDLGSERGGTFYGASVLASQDLTKNLELVGRAYYWASSEENGVRINSRYSRQDAQISNSGRGDAHASIYAGLNYYFAGQRSKIMTGVEWETLDTTSGSQEATTLSAAYRLFF